MTRGWIKLTNVDDPNDYWIVQTIHITTITPLTGGGGSIVSFISGEEDDYIRVAEAPIRVMELITSAR